MLKYIFRMRHKYRHFIEVMESPIQAAKEIEVDETYVTYCRKERKIKDHPWKKRGTPARKRGLSEEKICFLTAVQRLGNCIARSFNVAKPTIEDVLQFSRCIEDKSYVWTDGLSSYQKVLEE